MDRAYPSTEVQSVYSIVPTDWALVRGPYLSTEMQSVYSTAPPPQTDWAEGSYSQLANVVDCDIIVIEFELRSRYYIHFWTNTIGKGMNSLIPQAMGLFSITAVLLQGWF